MVCPFHGWVYNLDGTLRGAAVPDSFGPMDRAKFGLQQMEMEVFNGFVFLRFSPGPQAAVATLLAAYDSDFAGYQAANMLPVDVPNWSTDLPVNWKSVRDVDNERYHVPMAHPGLQDLYGRAYRDHTLDGGLAVSLGYFGDVPGRLWSVKHYIKWSPEAPHLPPHLQKAWSYYGLWPNAVFAFTPEAIQFYQEILIGPGKTRVTGRRHRRPQENPPAARCPLSGLPD